MLVHVGTRFLWEQAHTYVRVHNIVRLGRIWVCLAQYLLSTIVILSVTRVEGVDAHNLLCCKGDSGFHLFLQHQSAWQSETNLRVQNFAIMLVCVIWHKY